MAKQIFEQIRNDEALRGDTNFCGPVALAIVADRPIKEVNESMIRKGRRVVGKGVFDCDWKAELKDMRVEWIDVTKEVKAAGATTVNNITKVLNPNKRYLINIRGHLLAFAGGEIQDWTADRRHKITRVLEIVDGNAPATYKVEAENTAVLDLEIKIKEALGGWLYTKRNKKEVNVEIKSGSLNVFLAPLKDGTVRCAIGVRRFWNWEAEILLSTGKHFTKGKSHNTCKFEDEDEAMEFLHSLEKETRW